MNDLTHSQNISFNVELNNITAFYHGSFVTPRRCFFKSRFLNKILEK